MRRCRACYLLTLLGVADSFGGWLVLARTDFQAHAWSLSFALFLLFNLAAALFCLARLPQALQKEGLKKLDALTDGLPLLLGMGMLCLVGGPVNLARLMGSPFVAIPAEILYFMEYLF